MNEAEVCPACGKPTGGYIPCPHCGADPRARLGIRSVALLCSVLLGVGCFYFLLHIQTLAANPVPIANIDSWLNYASIWIEGTVVSGPRMTERSVAFDVQDTSGEVLEVNVYLSPENLEAQGMIPRVGDEVKVFGMLRVFLGGRLELRVSAIGKDEFTGEERLQVTRVQPVSTTIGELIETWPSLRYRQVTLAGRITGMRPLLSAKIYTLEDEEGRSVDVYVHNGLRYLQAGEPELKLLQEVSLTAGASEFGGIPQIAVASREDVKVKGELTPENLVVEAAGLARTFENEVKEALGSFLENLESLRNSFENVAGAFSDLLGNLNESVETLGGALAKITVGIEGGSAESVLELLTHADNLGLFLEGLASEINGFLTEVENSVSQEALEGLRGVRDRFLERAGVAYVGAAINVVRGKFVRVAGQIIFVELRREWDSLRIEDVLIRLGDMDCPVLKLDGDVFGLLPDETQELLRRGSLAEFTGRTTKYGKLSIEVAAPVELSLEGGTYEPPLVENFVELSALVGELVTVKGTLIAIENRQTSLLLPPDRELMLQDNFGGVAEIMIQNHIYERMLEQPSEGERLRVVGEVVESRGEIQVRPGVPEDVRRVG